MVTHGPWRCCRAASSDPPKHLPERALRRVPDGGGHRGQRDEAMLAQHARGTDHAPLREMIARRVSHQGTEAGGERRPRHGHLAGQFRYRPGSPRLGVHQPQRHPDVRVGQAAEPAGIPSGSGAWMRVRMACMNSTSASLSTITEDPGRSCTSSVAMNWSVAWSQGDEEASDAETWMIGGRYLTGQSLSGVANVKHPAITEAGIPPPPAVITRDCRKASGEITSSPERTAISGLLRRE
jgi:hypothetical protein